MMAQRVPKARMAEPKPVTCHFVEGYEVQRGDEFIRLTSWVHLETVEYAPPEQRIVGRHAMPISVARKLVRDLRKALARGGH